MSARRSVLNSGLAGPGPEWVARLGAAGRRSASWLRRPRLPPSRFPPALDDPIRLLVGPTNSAGQGWAWARSAADHVPGVGARTFAVRRREFGFPDDYGVTPADYGHPTWQRRHEEYVAARFTHVLVEAMRPLFGTRNGRDAAGDIATLRRAGLDLALVLHGSEIRLPSAHALREPWSPFGDDDLSRRLQAQADRFRTYAGTFDGPVFVSTPDLLAEVPSATWLPVVIDPDRWAAPGEPLRRPRPVVVHAPSNPRFKGSQVIDAVLGTLASRGSVEYRRLDAVPNDAMPRVLAGADIVIDQLVMGLYGVAASEAMAAGRVVVSYVGDRVRTEVRRSTGREVPIVEANPSTLSDVLHAVLDDRDTARTTAGRGPGFVRELHDGRRSASLLRPWLVSAGSPPDDMSG